MADVNNPHGLPRSGIPRPSRLPVPTSLNRQPSRDSLRAPPPTSLQNPGSRQPSREPLGRSTSSNRNSVQHGQQPVLRAKPSQDVFKRPAARPPSSQLETAPAARTRISSGDVFKKPATRPSSRQQMRAPSATNDVYGTPTTDESEHAVTSPSKEKSLSERVQETLATIPVPESPDMRRRRSSFFNTESPMRPPSRSMAHDGMMRPPSRHAESRPVSRQMGSRPASRQGGHTGGIPLNFGAASTPAKSIPSLRTPIKNTPGVSGLRAPRSVSNLRLATSPRVSTTPSIPASPSPGFGSAIKSGSKTVGQALKPRASVNNLFDDISVPQSTSRIGQTIGRSPQPRQSIQGYFDVPGADEPSASPSHPPIGRTQSLKPRTSHSLLRRVSTQELRATPQQSTAPVSRMKKPVSTSTSTCSKNHDAPAEERPKTESAIKSSLALRETIAKAKAAKRAVMAKAQAPTPTMDEKSPILPTDSFDFGLSDPFNLNKSEDVGTGLLRKRIDAARTDGRLNIAAIGLKKIPDEVMNMYNLSSITSGNWAECVDLTKFIAADNEFESISDDVFPDCDPREMAEDEDSQGMIFGGLETLDLHGNMLISIPMGLRRLEYLTVLNLSNNKLGNEVLDIISQITSLRELKLANNALVDEAPGSLLQLSNLEVLDLHQNKLSALPQGVSALTRLKSLNISQNSLTNLPIESLRNLPLIELFAASNKLSGTLIEASNIRFEALRTLDLSGNSLQLVSEGSVILPNLQLLNVSANRLKALPGVETWESIMTLSAADNSIAEFPRGFAELPVLKLADFGGNDIRMIPDQIAIMASLETLVVSGNPLQQKKFAGMNTADLKRALLARLEPFAGSGDEATGFVEQEESGFFNHSRAPTHNRDRSMSGASMVTAIQDDHQDDDSTGMVYLDAPAADNAGLPRSPTAAEWSSNINTQLGVLDRSYTNSSTLNPLIAAQIASHHKIKTVELHHNSFTEIPASIAFFGGLTTLNLSHNGLSSDTWIRDTVELPNLVELNLSSNTFDSLTPVLRWLEAPNLAKLDVSFNRLTALPSPSSTSGHLRSKFPKLTILLASNNKLREMNADSVRGLRTIDASSNEIERMDPKLGLLMDLKQLEISGNRFRVPNWRVVEKGTEGVLEWCRGRLQPEELEGSPEREVGGSPRKECGEEEQEEEGIW